MSASISIDGNHGLGDTPATAFGLNTAVWDGHLTDAEVPGFLHSVSVGVLRYPGGSTSDAYDWAHNAVAVGQTGYVNPNNGFDSFMQKVAQPSGAQPMITR